MVTSRALSAYRHLIQGLDAGRLGKSKVVDVRESYSWRHRLPSRRLSNPVRYLLLIEEQDDLSWHMDKLSI